jgi:NAD(P)H-binding
LARVLIVGCGCRGRLLAGALGQGGHPVRGTTRDPAALRAIEAEGAEAALADPDRLSTLLTALAGVSVVVWLMGTANGDEEAVAALHGPRLESMAGKLVDSPARGLVYEAAGTAGAARLAEGVAHRMPVEVVEANPADSSAWLGAMTTAIERVLAV